MLGVSFCILFVIATVWFLYEHLPANIIFWICNFTFQAVNPSLRVLVDEEEVIKMREGGEEGDLEEKEKKKYRCSENVFADDDENKGFNS